MEQLKFEDLHRKVLSEQGFNLLESFFPGDKTFSDVNWRKISYDEFKPGFVLIDTKECIRVSKRKYSFKNLLRFIQLKIEDFQDNLFCISANYDLIYYGYIPGQNIGFILIGKRVINDSTLYYKQGEIHNTKLVFQQIQEWFDFQESLQEKTDKKQDQNNAAS